MQGVSQETTDDGDETKNGTDSLPEAGDGLAVEGEGDAPKQGMFDDLPEPNFDGATGCVSSGMVWALFSVVLIALMLGVTYVIFLIYRAAQ